MVQYSGKDYKYVQEALQYLEKFTPHHLRVFSFATSDYHFGHKLPFHYDRCHVEFHSHSLYQDPVKAQIVFDSSNYTFPPDIIFLNPAALPNVEPQAWLPTDWDITAKTCLVEWLQHIEELLFQGTSRKLSVPDIMAVDSEEDRSESLSVRTGASVEPVRSPSHGTVTRRVSNSGSHPSSILPHAEMVEFRRSFIQQCLMQYNDHVIRYDDKEFFSISLYLTVKIPSDLFQELQEYHCQAVQQRPEPKVAKARQEAPVIVSLQLPQDFPLSDIRVHFISAVNTQSPSIPIPDQAQFTFPVNLESSLPDMVADLFQLVLDDIPKFHSQLFVIGQIDH